MSDETFQTLDAKSISRELVNLYQLVARNKGRVEIDSPDGGCVIISKAELESLEKALAVLADGDGVKQVCDSLAQVVALCESGQAAAGNG